MAANYPDRSSDAEKPFAILPLTNDRFAPIAVVRGPGDAGGMARRRGRSHKGSAERSARTKIEAQVKVPVSRRDKSDWYCLMASDRLGTVSRPRKRSGKPH